jgi:hypothetical protein
MSDAARIFTPLLLWLALFSGVYAVHGLGCGLGWTEVPAGPLTLHRWALVGAAAGAVAVQGGLLLAILGRLGSGRAFVRGLSVTLAVAGVVAVVWSLFPVLFASSCTYGGEPSRGW